MCKKLETKNEMNTLIILFVFFFCTIDANEKNLNESESMQKIKTDISELDSQFQSNFETTLKEKGESD